MERVQDCDSLLQQPAEFYLMVVAESQHFDARFWKVHVPPPQDPGESWCHAFLRTLYPSLSDVEFEQAYDKLRKDPRERLFIFKASRNMFEASRDRPQESLVVVYVIDWQTQRQDLFTPQSPLLDPTWSLNPRVVEETDRWYPFEPWYTSRFWREIENKVPADREPTESHAVQRDQQQRWREQLAWEAKEEGDFRFRFAPRQLSRRNPIGEEAGGEPVNEPRMMQDMEQAGQWLWQAGVRSPLAAIEILLAASSPTPPHVPLALGQETWAQQVVAIHEVSEQVRSLDLSPELDTVVFLLCVQGLLQDLLQRGAKRRYSTTNFIAALAHRGQVELKPSGVRQYLFAAAEETGRENVQYFASDRFHPSRDPLEELSIWNDQNRLSAVLNIGDLAHGRRSSLNLEDTKEWDHLVQHRALPCVSRLPQVSEGLHLPFQSPPLPRVWSQLAVLFQRLPDSLTAEYYAYPEKRLQAREAIVIGTVLQLHEWFRELDELEDGVYVEIPIIRGSRPPSSFPKWLRPVQIGIEDEPIDLRWWEENFRWPRVRRSLYPRTHKDLEEEKRQEREGVMMSEEEEEEEEEPGEIRPSRCLWGVVPSMSFPSNREPPNPAWWSSIRPTSLQEVIERSLEQNDTLDFVLVDLESGKITRDVLTPLDMGRWSLPERSSPEWFMVHPPEVQYFVVVGLVRNCEDDRHFVAPELATPAAQFFANMIFQL